MGKIYVKLSPKATIFARNGIVVLQNQVVEVDYDIVISQAIAVGHLVLVHEDEVKASQESKPEEKPKKVSKIALDKE